MDAYLVNTVGPFATALGASFGTFTTKQDVSPTPSPVIPANVLRIGSRIKIEAEGEFSTTATPTLVLGFYVGLPGASGAPAAITTTIAESSAITTASGAAAFPWRMEYRGLVTIMGTSGSITGQGNIDFGTALTTFSSTPIPITAALRTVTLDTTIARAFGVCATYSASSASNTVRVHNITVQLLN